MKIWQVDFHHFTLFNDNKRQWKLIICDSSKCFVYTAECDSTQANTVWLEQQFMEASKGNLPEKIQIFRPQALSLLTLVANKLKIAIEATRHTTMIKEELKSQYQQILPNYNPLALDKPAPKALPEDIRGEEWQIASIAAGDIINIFQDRPIPFKYIPESFLPINLGISSNVSIPGIVIYGGRKSIILSRWLAEEKPAFLEYIPTKTNISGGFILETGLITRWIFNTFESEQAALSAKNYELKKQASRGIHFLLIQPDASGMTYTGFWLLKQEN